MTGSWHGKEAGVKDANKTEWTKPELYFGGYLRDLVQSGGKVITGTGDGPDPFAPKK